MLFGVVYFAQGMYYVVGQPLTLTLKETLGLSAAQVATFGTITLMPWVIKPLYGLLSDAVPLFGRRRKSYFILMSLLAAAAGFLLAALKTPTYWSLVLLVVLMSFGIAFTDVLTDAMMVRAASHSGSPARFSPFSGPPSMAPRSWSDSSAAISRSSAISGAPSSSPPSSRCWPS